VLPATSQRVALNTDETVNAAIRRKTAANLAYFAEHPDEIRERLEELDHEWDIERVLETQASSLSLLGLFLGTTVDRPFMVLPAVVMGFFLQHALQGWCPPVPVLRRLGVRTQSEIEHERYALMALRGDFNDASKLLRFTRGRRR